MTLEQELEQAAELAEAAGRKTGTLDSITEGNHFANQLRRRRARVRGIMASPRGQLAVALDLTGPLDAASSVAIGGHGGQSEPVVTSECVRCLTCKRCAAACDCTGGPTVDTECTCYELTGGHQPRCAFNRTPIATPKNPEPAPVPVQGTAKEPA